MGDTKFRVQSVSQVYRNLLLNLRILKLSFLFISSGQLLNLNDVSADDSGLYTCVMTLNTDDLGGMLMASMTVTVVGELAHLLGMRLHSTTAYHSTGLSP